MSYGGHRGDKYVYQVDQAYDNKAYGGSHHSRSSGSRYVEDPHYHEAQPRRERSRHREKSNRKCYVFIAVFAFILLIGAAIAIGVYFGVTSDDDKDKPTPAAATVPVTLSLDEQWNNDYLDPESVAYKNKASEVQNGIDVAMTGVEGYMSNKVISIREGSVEVTTNIFCKSKQFVKGDKTVQLSDTAGVAKLVNENLEEKKAKIPFVDKLHKDKTKALYFAGEKGNSDLNEACTRVSDCEDLDVECSGSGSKVCKCKSGYYNKNKKEAGGFCAVGKAFGQTCDDNDKECTYNGGACNEKKCGCDVNTFEKSGQCQSKIDIDRPGCGDDKECMYDGASCSQGMCKCMGEFYKASGRCAYKIDIDMSGCSNDDQCKSNSKCVQGTCRCTGGLKNDKGSCVSDRVPVCDRSSLRYMVEQACGTAFGKYKETRQSRYLRFLLGCVYFHAVVRGETCDLGQVFEDITDIYAEMPFELGVCSTRYIPFNTKDYQVVLATSKSSEYMNVELLMRNGKVTPNMWAAVGVSDTRSMANTLAVTFEHPSLVDEEDVFANIRFTGVNRDVPIPVDGKPNANSVHVSLGNLFMSLTLRMHKGMSHTGVSFTGQKYLLFAQGLIEEKEMKKHSQKAVSSSTFDLDCDKTKAQGLAELVSGIKEMKDFCEDVLTMRYLLELECTAVSPAYSDDGKCLVRMAAKRCVLKHLKSFGLPCTIEQVAATMRDEFVTDNLYEGFPNESCEDKFPLSECEEKVIANSLELISCMDFLAEAVLLTKFVDVSLLKSSDGTNTFTCSLWKGGFQCYEPFFRQYQCTPAQISNIVATGSQIQQQFVMNHIGYSSEYFTSSGDMSVIDYTRDCPVRDLVITEQPCPPDSLIADTIITRCALQVEIMKKYHPTVEICLLNPTDCAIGVVTKLFATWKCTKNVQAAVTHSFKTYPSFYKDNLGMDPTDCKFKGECLKYAWANEACSASTGLLLVEDKLSQKEACASSELMVTDVIPQCFKYAMPECQTISKWLWDTMRVSVMASLGKGTSKLDNCANYQDTCDTAPIRTLFSCWNLYHEYGECGALQCLKSPKSLDGCTAVTVEAVANKSNAIYGRLPMCTYGECGQGGFDHFKESCFPAWDAWMKTKNCEAFRAFTGCSAFMMVTQGVDYCGFKQLEENINAGAGSDGGSVCRSDDVDYTARDAQFSNTKDGLCGSALLYRMIFEYFCTPSQHLFITDSEEDQCMSEVARKVCLYSAFSGSKVRCDDEAVWNLIATPEVSNGIFTQNGCENGYQCVTSVLTQAEHLVACTSGIIKLLSLSEYGVDIENLQAKGSGHLKCKILDLMTMCVNYTMMILGDYSCLGKNSNQIRLALKILADQEVGKNEEIPVKANTFDTCPAYEPVSPKCPENDELVHLFASECGGYGLKAKREKKSNEEVCRAMYPCALGIIEAYKSLCSDIEDRVERLKTAENQYQIYRMIGISCAENKAGMCPKVLDDEDGICIYDCTNDITCQGDQKCCNNGCGYTCQPPYEEWPKCGKGVFSSAMKACYPAFQAWGSNTGPTKCQDYEALVLCTIYHYKIYDRDYCGLAELHKNLQDGAVEAGYSRPELCSNSKLAAKVPDTKASICPNPHIMNAMLKYFCPRDPEVFSNQPCISEMTRVVCVGSILEQSGLQCDPNVITATKNLPEARDGVFDGQAAKCEESSPCIFELAYTASKVEGFVCHIGVTNYLTMGGYGLDVNNLLARGSDDKLKCKLLNTVTSCGLLYSSEACQNSPDDVAKGVLFLAHLMSYLLPKTAPKVNIFDECPDFDKTINPCDETGNQLLYSALTFCGLEPVRGYMLGGQSEEEVCSAFGMCAPYVTLGYNATCQNYNIARANEHVLSRESRRYFKDVTRINCLEPPVWNECGVGAFDDAYEACGAAFKGWSSAADTDKCMKFEGFFACTVYHYTVYGKNYCGTQTLVNNLKGDAESLGFTLPSSCGSLVSNIDSNMQLDFCINPYVYNVILTYYCPPGPFSGSLKEDCMSENIAVYCLGYTLSMSGLKCDPDDIEKTKNEDAAREGVFSHAKGCEESYPCVFDVPRKAQNDSGYYTCAEGLNKFASLAKYGIDIVNFPAIDSTTKKLKCMVLDSLTACSLDLSSDGCSGEDKIPSVRSGLMLLAAAGESLNPRSTSLVGMFDDCPTDFDLEIDRCNDKKEAVYQSIIYCSEPAVKAHRYHKVSQEEACGYFIGCVDHVLEEMKKHCENLDKDGAKQYIVSKRGYFKDFSELDCPEP